MDDLFYRIIGFISAKFIQVICTALVLFFLILFAEVFEFVFANFFTIVGVFVCCVFGLAFIRRLLNGE